jgi:hypothetical protein
VNAFSAEGFSVFFCLPIRPDQASSPATAGSDFSAYASNDIDEGEASKATFPCAFSSFILLPSYFRQGMGRSG